LVASPDGKKVIRIEGSATPASAEALGRQLAQEALAQGAKTLISKLEIGD
jgi:porphobilinogen deaminase